MTDLRLRVGGREFAGWTSARVTRSMECVAGAFQLEVTDRWAGQPVARPINEEDACELLLGNTTVISGHVDSRNASIGATSRSFGVSGRDRTSALVDCSAVMSTWEFYDTSVLTLAKLICKPFGIPVALQPGMAAPRAVAKLTIDPGDTAFDAIERACRAAAILPVADGAGGLLLTRAGSNRAVTALVEGENILAASIDYDGTSRFARYLVTGQRQGTDADFGADAAMVQGSARDSGVRRTDRVLMVRAESGVTPELAAQRAAWEAKVRAGRAESARVTVQGWTQGNGALWPVNARVSIRSPSLGVDGEMLITEATFRVDSGGTITELRLRPPGAFLPEPVVTDAGGQWKELRPGAK